MMCSSCADKDKCGCDGCLSNNSGECEIKICCKSRGLQHCGLCSDFPCDLLRNTAFDEADGDDGERILNCKHWAENDTGKKYYSRKNIIIGAACGLISGAIIGSITVSLAVWIPVGIFLGVAAGILITVSKND